MSFASFEFAFFAPIFFALYALFGWRYPVAFIGAASLFFYGWWDPSYLPLLIASASIDYVAGLRIHAATEERRRRVWLTLSVVSNLAILVFFKYWTFLFGDLARATGYDDLIHDVLLPLGLSFYTLQTLGYTIDVFRRKVAPERNFFTYLLFVSFFPQLVAGPIERAGKLLPQLRAIPPFTLRAFHSGFVLVTWGLFMKLAVADNLVAFVNSAMAAERPGLMHWGVGFVGMFQVYTDFYAYTLIARGLARALGVDLSENFRQPLFAKHLTGFWQRWHITLTRWIMDYVHLPIARRMPEEPGRSASAIAAMCLVGLWHGASWNFLLFGLFHGVVMRLWQPASRWLGQVPHPQRYEGAISRVLLFAVLSFSAPMFLVPDIGQLGHVLAGMASTHLGVVAILGSGGKFAALLGCALASLVILNDFLIPPV